MLTAADRVAMAATLAEIRADKEVMINIARDTGTAPGPQAVRITRLGSGARNISSAGGEARAKVLVNGPADLDIKIADRFQDGNGQAYRVYFVRPDRDIQTEAEAELTQ